MLVLVLTASCRFQPLSLGSSDATIADVATTDASVDARVDAPVDAVPFAEVQVLGPGYVSAASLPIILTETAGDVLIAATYWEHDPNTITVTDTAGLEWTALPIEKIPSGCGSPGYGSIVQLWYAVVATTRTDTVTVTQAATTLPLGMFVIEYAGLGAFDVAAGRVAPAASNGMSTGNFTTTSTDLVLALFIDTLGTGTMTPGSGWTARAHDANFYAVIEDNAPGVAAGVLDPSAQLPIAVSDACWVAAAVAFHSPS